MYILYSQKLQTLETEDLDPYTEERVDLHQQLSLPVFGILLPWWRISSYETIYHWSPHIPDESINYD
jgi:hypothetical protein